MLIVNEIYKTILGESTYAGLPGVIIRLTGCNLRCTYCDTAYAYDAGKRMMPDKILSKIAKINLPYALITGGEPLLQKQAPELAGMLCDKGFHVIVETNGTIDISVLAPEVIKIVDIKTPGSGAGNSFLPGNLQQITFRDELKFVIVDEEDFKWTDNFIRMHLKNCPAKILLSPEMKTLELHKLAEWILESGINVRLNMQIHKFIWHFKERGV